MDSLLGSSTENDLPNTIKRDAAEAAANPSPHIIVSYLGLALFVYSSYYLIQRL